MNHREKSLNQLLKEAGITTHYTNGDKRPGTHLEFNGKIIDMPKHNYLYKVVLREYGIDLTTFND